MMGNIIFRDLVMPDPPSLTSLLILKLQPCLLPHSAINARNIALITRVVHDFFEMLICDFHSFQSTATRLCQALGMSSILPREVSLEERFFAVEVVSCSHALRVSSVWTRKHGLDEGVQIIRSQAGFLCEDVSFGEGFDHVEDEGVALRNVLLVLLRN